MRGRARAKPAGVEACRGVGGERDPRNARVIYGCIIIFITKRHERARG